MKLKTLQPITYAQWLEQAGRFTRGKDQLITRNLPENTDKSGIAEIDIDIKKPLLKGFEAVVTYKQHFIKTIEVDAFDVDGNATGEKELIDTNQVAEIISYYEKMDRAAIDETLQQIDALIDPELKGLDRQEATVGLAILKNVVHHTTFQLAETDWEIIN